MAKKAIRGKRNQNETESNALKNGEATSMATQLIPCPRAGPQKESVVTTKSPQKTVPPVKNLDGSPGKCDSRGRSQKSGNL